MSVGGEYNRERVAAGIQHRAVGRRIRKRAGNGGAGVELVAAERRAVNNGRRVCPGDDRRGDGNGQRAVVQRDAVVREAAVRIDQRRCDRIRAHWTVAGGDAGKGSRNIVAVRDANQRSCERRVRLAVSAARTLFAVAVSGASETFTVIVPEAVPPCVSAMVYVIVVGPLLVGVKVRLVLPGLMTTMPSGLVTFVIVRTSPYGLTSLVNGLIVTGTS